MMANAMRGPPPPGKYLILRYLPSTNFHVKAARINWEERNRTLVANMVSSNCLSILGPMVDISTGIHHTCATMIPADTTVIIARTTANSLPIAIRLCSVKFYLRSDAGTTLCQCEPDLPFEAAHSRLCSLTRMRLAPAAPGS